MLQIEDQVIYLTRGDDANIRLDLITDSGDAYEMGADDALVLTIRALPDISSPALLAIPGAPGSDTIVIRHPDTAGLAVGQYSADVELRTGDGLRYTVWPKLEGSNRRRVRNYKNFVLMSEVTIDDDETTEKVELRAVYARELAQIDTTLTEITEAPERRVETLAEGSVISGTNMETVGIPEYISDVTQYAAYGITEPGWYTFARITARGGATVTEATVVTGAAGVIAEAGADHVDVAVLFGVAAESQTVRVNWGPYTDTLVFKATDLAVRNLDYRTTFYLYDLSPYAVWSYVLTTDATFAAGKAYFTKDGDEYTPAEVTAGEAVPAGTYYVHSKLRLEGMTKNVTYKLDTIVDCPIEIALPEVENPAYGAWFEMQMRYNGSYSCTLLPPEGVKIGTVSTQNQTAGINVIDLQYTGVGGVQMWSLLNTHSNIPA